MHPTSLSVHLPSLQVLSDRVPTFSPVYGRFVCHDRIGQALGALTSHQSTNFYIQDAFEAPHHLNKPRKKHLYTSSFKLQA